MSLNDKLLKAAAVDSGITPSDHFGVMLYEGNGSSSSHSINGGKFGGAAYFNGSNGKIDIGTLGNIFINNFSFSLWFNLDTIASSGIAALFTTFEDYYCYAFIRDSDKKVEVRVENASTGYAIKSTSTFGTYGVWHHLAVTKSSSGGLKIYINGSLENTDSTATVDLKAMNGDNLIGAYNAAGSTQYYLEGKIDQLRIFSKTLSSSEVSTLYAETAATVESLDPLSEDTTDTLQVLGDTSCVALYKLENDETDVSGNFNGTGYEVEYGAGRYGQAGSFDDNGYIDTGTVFTTMVGSSTSYSVSGWVFPTSTDTGRPFGAEHYNDGFMVETSSDTVKIGCGNGSFSLSSTYSCPRNVWSHICVVITTNSSMALYVNGVLKETLTNTISFNGSNKLFIGADYDASSKEQPFTGRVDQVRVFNKALSASEVTTLYEENSLVASYRFEGNSSDDRRTYDGTDSNMSYEFGLNFTPDFVWIKNRGSSGENHSVYDNSRTLGNPMYPNLSIAEGNPDDKHIDSMDQGGFTLGTDNHNGNGNNYVAWCWKAGGGTTATNNDGELTVNVQANQDAGFSIITFDGVTDPGEDRSFGHGLSKSPEFIWMKRRGSAQHNAVFAKINGTWEYFDGTSSNDQGGDYSAYIATTSTVIDIHDAAEWFADASSQYVYWCWHSVENYSKIGTYTGDRPNDVLVETGFEVGFVMIKAVDATDDWFIVDNKRGDNLLYANLANAETSFSGVSFLSNGFVLNGSQNSGGTNNSGTTFLYMAFAVDPDTEAPTLAKSFSTVTYDGTGANQSIEGLGFKPGFVWLKGRSRAEDSGLFDIVRGPNLWLRSSTNAAESDFSGNYGVLSFDDDGFSIGTGSAINNSGDTYVGWAWAADDNEPTIFGGAAKAVYKFEDNVNDVTGNYNGSATSITYNSSGNFNKSAEFNGSNSQITTSLAQSDTAAFTWSAWIKVHDFQGVNNVNVLGTMNPSSPYNGVAIFLDVASISLGEGGSNIGNIIASPSTNTWYHIVVAYDGSTFKCYVDGSLALTVTNSNTDGGNFWMGKGGPTSWTAFDGELDQVRVYNGAVSDIGVAALYAETVSQNDDLSLGGPAEIKISANANAGFSIIKYEGNGVAGIAKIPHGFSQLLQQMDYCQKT